MFMLMIFKDHIVPYSSATFFLGGNMAMIPAGMPGERSGHGVGWRRLASPMHTLVMYDPFILCYVIHIYIYINIYTLINTYIIYIYMCVCVCFDAIPCLQSASRIGCPSASSAVTLRGSFRRRRRGGSCRSDPSWWGSGRMASNPRGMEIYGKSMGYEWDICGISDRNGSFNT